MQKATLDIIKKIYYALKPSNKPGRPNTLPIELYIENIFKVLTTGMQWGQLENLHGLTYNAYYKKFKMLDELGIFRLAFKSITKFAHRKGFIQTSNLYIDGTQIRNVRGTDCIGKYVKDRNRNATKLTLIVNSRGIPLGISTIPGNQHDMKGVKNTIKDIRVKIVGCRLGGDKGYNSSPLKESLRRRGINLIYPYKRNQNRTNTSDEINFLRGRQIIESSFAWLRTNNRRLYVRWDKKIKCFESFIYFGLIDVLAKKIPELIIP